MSLDDLLSAWQNDPETRPNIAAWQTSPAKAPIITSFPSDFPPSLVQALKARGIISLYRHQAQVWQISRAGNNLVLASGTASGKTLAYNLPVIAKILEDPSARALFLFPTKALTQDQSAGLTGLLALLSDVHIQAAVYDGDTPSAKRSAIRQKANILFSNPDMLHTGILPHHTNWADFFRNLRFVVIDEMHVYRGVFGSHVANVIRRLKRVAGFYGGYPQFILTSATIANPVSLAEKLLDAQVVLVEGDDAARGARHFIIYNPPVINESLGLRKSAVQEAVRLSQDVINHGVQSVLFARSRRSVEILLKYLQETIKLSGKNTRSWLGDRFSPLSTSVIRGYRSGYLPADRREIEKGLREGSLRMVVATNALELGIDIGSLGAALLLGYPGTIASVRQQAGRAGRGSDPAVAVLIATPNPLDQFLAHHPEYLLSHSPESALINPDHILILLNHLRCALFEKPFEPGEHFGGLDVTEFLDFLVNNQEAHLSQEKYFWMADAYPAASVSLRSASPDVVVLQAEFGEGSRTIGEVDFASAFWMVHPEAIYLHDGQQYFVQNLNLETKTATLIPVSMDYYTETIQETEVKLTELQETQPVPGAEKSCGDLLVTTRVVGYKKRLWSSGEILGQESLEMPPSDLQTTGYWLSLSDKTVSSLARQGLWTNSANDYGPDWPKIRNQVRARDGFRCQVCGLVEESRQHEVHHKIPFRHLLRAGMIAQGSPDPEDEARLMRQIIARANRLDNLITLCPDCHRKAEQNVRMRSGLAGLAFVMSQLAPLFLMCDSADLGVHYDPQAPFAGNTPTVVLFDLIPAGIGFSRKLFEIHTELMARALELVESCPCESGCPSCVGPAGENGEGGKLETLALLRELTRTI